MPNWKPGTALRPDQATQPVLWVCEVDVDLSRVDASTAVLERGFGPGRSRRLRSWGHDEDGVHWLATRGGLGLHTDPNYARFTHHLIVRNDGWRLRGVDDGKRIRMLTPGVMYCLDTWSPHAIVPDLRINPRPIYKVQIAVDRDEALEPAVAMRLLLPWAGRQPADTIHLLAPGPAPRSPIREVTA